MLSRCSISLFYSVRYTNLSSKLLLIFLIFAIFIIKSNYFTTSKLKQNLTQVQNSLPNTYSLPQKLIENYNSIEIQPFTNDSKIDEGPYQCNDQSNVIKFRDSKNTRLTVLDPDKLLLKFDNENVEKLIEVEGCYKKSEEENESTSQETSKKAPLGWRA